MNTRLQQPAKPSTFIRQWHVPRDLSTARSWTVGASSPQGSPAASKNACAADEDRLIRAVSALQSKLGSVVHMFIGSTAAQLQGVRVPNNDTPVQVCVQWDSLQSLHAQFEQDQLQPGPISQQGRGEQCFHVQLPGTPALLQCQLNSVLRMDPDRIQVTDPITRQAYWCQSLLSVRQGAPPDLAAAVEQRLQQLQQHLTDANAQAWGQSEAEGAWLNKLGPPEDTARWICQDPWLRLGRPLFKHLPQQLTGLRLVNLLGSHGTKAVAAAVLGAQATCIDISPVNAAYGAKVAAAAGVEVEFVVADVLDLPPELLHGLYDAVLLELGVLHYFLDLGPLFAVVHQLLRPGGMLLLREFHPVSTKLITSKGKKHKVAGNYFAQDLVASDVAYSKYTEESQGKGKDGARKTGAAVKLRQWTMGEVVTSICAAGLVLQCLEEEPGVKADDAGLPKLFTLVATRQP